MFELRYLATVMCQFTGEATQVFDRVKCFESQAHVYWSFELREPFVPHQGLSAEQRNLCYFAHGTDTAGIEGMIHSRFIAPATKVDGPQAVGHDSQATPWNDDDSVQKLEESRRTRSHATPLQAVYLRCGLVAIIDEPFRTRAINQLRLTLTRRRGRYPPAIVPLRFPLAHDLALEVQRMLRFIVKRERVNFPPLHLPSAKMVEIKARTWSRAVYNFRTFLRSWTPGKGISLADCFLFSAQAKQDL